MAKVREFLRRAFDGSWDPSYAAKKLHVGLAGAEEIVAELQKRGYVRKEDSRGGEDRRGNTLQGNAFSHASGAKPLLRASADQKLKEFLVRVEEVGKNPYYLYRVCRVVVCGAI